MINAIINQKKYTDSELSWLMLINALNTPLFIFVLVYVIQLITGDARPSNFYDSILVFEIVAILFIEGLECACIGESDD